jgi:hypothetical protein
LNELLGGKEAGANETWTSLPKAGAGKFERAATNYPSGATEVAVSVAKTLIAPNTVYEAGQHHACNL